MLESTSSHYFFKSAKNISDAKFNEAQLRWQKEHDELCLSFSLHEKKHKEEFFALYEDYENLKKQFNKLKEKVKSICFNLLTIK